MAKGKFGTVYSGPTAESRAVQNREVARNNVRSAAIQLGAEIYGTGTRQGDAARANLERLVDYMMISLEEGDMGAYRASVDRFLGSLNMRQFTQRQNEALDFFTDRFTQWRDTL